MDSNSVSPLPQTAPMAEFDKTPPTPPEDTLPMDDLPPPPTTVNMHDEKEKDKDKEKEKEKEAEAQRHYEEENEWGCANWTEYIVVLVLACIFLLGSLALTIFWVYNYQGGPAWTDDPEKQFNLHPILMVAGFITFSGFSILMYRICRCGRRLYVKLLHMIFHALAIPCVAGGFLAVLDSHNLSEPPKANFYSLHSWIGLVTMGLFAIQFVVGFFSFLVLLCCEGGTACFRAALVPIHASFGLTTFMLAITACLTGLTQITNSLGESYSKWEEQGIVINALGMVLVALAILVSFAVRSPTLSASTKVSVTERL